MFRAAMLALAAALAGAAHAQQPIAIGTSPAGTLTYSLATAYAKVLLDTAQVQARVQPTSGTTAMMPLVNNGDIDSAFVNTLEVTEAYGGTGVFKGRPYQNVRMIGILFPIKVGFFVRKDSPFAPSRTCAAGPSPTATTPRRSSRRSPTACLRTAA
jgi:TRAP-type uncharacterized transport system substrate-binding protein